MCVRVALKQNLASHLIILYGNELLWSFWTSESVESYNIFAVNVKFPYIVRYICKDPKSAGKLNVVMKFAVPVINYQL
jgi:hypothetical protein